MCPPAIALTPTQLQAVIARQPLLVAPETTVLAALTRMAAADSSYVLVVDSGLQPSGSGLLGLLTTRDLVRLSLQATPLDQLPIQAVMSQPVITLNEADFITVDAALTLFQQHHMHHLPVLDERGHVVGLIERGCLTELLAQHVLQSGTEAVALKPDAIAAQPTQTGQAGVEPPPQAMQVQAEGHNASGQVIRMSGFETDMTQRKQAEQALQESERRYASLTAAAPVAIFRFDAPLNCVYVNDRWSKMTGRSKASAMGRGWIEALHPDDRDRLVAQYADNYAQATPGSQILNHGEGRHLRPDGSINWFYVQVAQEMDADGKAIGYIGTLTDITERKQAEVALRKSEERYRALMDGASDAILLADAQGNLVEVNQKAEVLLGYSREELTHLHMSQIHPPEALEAARNHFTDVISQHVSPTLESVVLRKDGSQVPVEITASRVELDGKPFAQGIFRDMSERKAIEKQLQLTQYSVDNAAEGVLWINLDFSFFYANQAICRMLGYSIDELLRMSIFDIDPDWTPETCQVFWEEYQQGATGFSFESRHQAKDGRIYPVEIVGNYHVVAGQALKFVRVRDISDRKRIEAELAESEAKFRRLVEGGHDLIWAKDIEGRFTYLSPQFQTLFGWEPQEWIGQAFVDLVHPDDQLRLTADYRENVQAGRKSKPEFRHRHRDGHYIWVSISATPIFNADGEVIGQQGILTDISERARLEAERKQAESALQLSEARFRSAFDNTAVGMCLVSPDGQYLKANAALCTFLGYSEAELLALRFQDLTHPDDLASSLDFAAQILAGAIHCYQIEKRYFTKQGHSVWGLLSVSLVRDAQEQPLYLVSQIQDITERKRSETERKQAELALEQEVLRRATVFNASSDGIHIVDRAGNIIEANESFARMLGYTPTEITHLNITDWDTQWAPEELSGMLQRDSINALTFETLHRRKDGSVFPVEISTRPMEWHGEISLVCISRDISERKQTELALQESQRFIQQIADASPNILYLYDLQEQRNAYVNREIGVILGYSPEAIQAMGSELFQTLIHPDDSVQFPQYFAQICAAQDGDILEFEYRMRHANGEWRWLYSRDTVFSRDANGNVKQIIGTTQDISDRKRLEQEQNRLIAILEASTDYILIADVAGRAIWNNAALKRLRGLESDVAVAQQTPIDYHPQYAVELLVQQAVPAAIDSGSWVGENVLLDAEGQEIPVSQLILSHKSPQGEVEFFSSIMRDMRVRKEYEQRLEQTNAELLRATRLKDEFLANMSHELRTPLNAILGLSEGLQEDVFGVLNNRQKKTIATIERSGHHLLELINDILEVSKIAAGKLELAISSVAVTQLCTTSLAFVKQQALQKQIELTTVFPPTELGDILVDERRLRQVLINLLTNAVKFTPTGGRVTLEVHLETTVLNLSERVSLKRSTVPRASWDQPVGACCLLQDYDLCLSVMDTGIGIAAADQTKLFQPFVQLDSRLNRQYEGTGLGLTLVKQIVELHGGAVSLQSEPGQGSCFTVRLPYVSSWAGQRSTAKETSLNPEVAADNASLLEPPEAIAATPLILLAEDNEANINTLSSYLTAKHYRMLLARNGQEAVALAHTHRPDLILMDIQMSGMDGLEAIRQLRLDPHLLDRPIIALTALAMTGDRERCLEAGANDYLTKPVKLKQLVALIQQLLDAKNNQ